MPLDLDTLANSRLGLVVAEGVARSVPPGLGGRLAATAAGVLAADEGSAIVRAVRANQWVVSGGSLRGAALDERVRRTLEQMALNVYDLYRYRSRPDALLERVSFTPAVDELLARARAGGSFVLASAHLSNFDLVGEALALRGLRAQVLSVPDPTGAYEAQNKLRGELGMEVTPLSLTAIRAAERRLRAGGVVVTGIDRPSPQVRHRPRFFGRSAPLPVVHVRLAARAGVPVVAFAIRLRGDGVYEADCATIELRRGNGDEITVENAEAVLAYAEGAIEAHPEQWAMPHEVWPDAADELAAIEERARKGSA